MSEASSEVAVRPRRVRGDGVDLAVFEQGDPARPTVLLVHGYPDTHAVWDGVAGLLARDHHVVRYDVRGAGDSAHPPGTRAYAFEHLMADLRAVLDAVAAGPVHLAGHDWGSIQAWEAVCTMPDRFASFTSISGPCLDHVGRLNRRDPRVAAGQLVRSWYIPLFRIPVLPEALWRGGLARACAPVLRPGRGPALARDAVAGLGLYRANMADRLGAPRERRTAVPTQVIVPLRDAFVSPRLVTGLREWAPDLTLRRLDVGHWAPRTRPGPIAGWIAEHAARAGR
ncbi:hypothetical protein DPM19_16705 [Actinomadura craniellae]|uniref:AB hydrolase-1 domain-containing protein n=1 Tax=Actinomadura craniellae TaxID=2231787 RepID=A0A365H4J1_9ACTN|nr:alpha/beta fold hydrolase [Actinomadura craniellae]RAY13938.1 hypothetical protein DPM19_16705 [Actinomadura craniellae]